MAKPQRKCIFCQGGNLTREHLWPQWASEYLPKFPENSHEERFYTFTEKTKLVGPPKHRKTNGRIWTKKIKVVCKTCNETWMSKLEEKAKAVIIPLITGSSHTISQGSCLIISKWIALKIMVAEHNNLNDPGFVVTTQEMRTRFKDKLEIPNNYWVMIAQCGAPGWEATYIRHTATLFLNNASTDMSKNIQCITLGIGQLLIQVLHTRDDLKLNYRNTSLIRRIYPTLDDINWPFTRALSRDEAYQFSMCLDNLIRGSNVRWIP